MTKTKELIHRGLSFLTAGVVVCSLFLFAACSSSQSVVLAETPEPAPTATVAPTLTPSPTPEPTPSLSTAQKAAMIWAGDNYQTCYPMDVCVFYGNIGGTDRLIWTCLENPETGRTYSFLEPSSAGELRAYDLFNHEYLFALTVPASQLINAQAGIFYRYVKDVSPSLKDASFTASQSIFNLELFYKTNHINYSGISDVDSLIMSYIYVQQYNIVSWDKHKSIEAFSAVTPSDYILPYWEFIPDTVMPADFYALDSSDDAAKPAVAYTAEQKALMLGMQPNNSLFVVGSIDCFFCKVNGDLRIIWAYTTKNRDKSDDENTVFDIHSIFNKEYLFSLSYSNEDKNHGIMYTRVWQYFSESSESLDGMKLLGSTTLSSIPGSYSEWGIPYVGNEFIDAIAASFKAGDYSFSDTPLLQEEIGKLYLDTVPDQYIMPFWEYVPGAQIPEELKELFTDESPHTDTAMSPAP